ncbi:MAG: glycoside hydrolase family 9 protein [Cytophagaceae bacterium]
MKTLIRICCYVLLSLTGLMTVAQTTDAIRVNQVGFYPNSPKVAIVTDSNATEFTIVNAATKQVVYTGAIEKMGVWEYSDEFSGKADFTKFTTVGKYYVSVKGVGDSYPFEIAPQANLNIGKASLRFFYYQRACIDLPEQYAGKWARKAGHVQQDGNAVIHSSAATSERPEGTKFYSGKGWYDAGDYNKYIVNSGISTYTLMALYEGYPKFFDTLKLNIPESNNNMPDLLDEVLWNLRWMLTMQDKDGGVYHKLTNTNFDGSVEPSKATNTRYAIMKTTAATLDFSAVMAVAYRVYRKFDKKFADSCLKASVQAYSWAQKNNKVIYNQGGMNQKFNPDINTGAYDDANVSDEFQWAAIELFIATGKLRYMDDANIEFTIRNNFDTPTWAAVNTLGLYSLIQNRDNLPEEFAPTLDLVKEKIVSMASKMQKYQASKSEFGIVMGERGGNFNWGSNSTAANQGMMMMIAYRLTGESDYLNAAISNLDYLLGRNGTGYCYVTGFGSKPTMNPHHRPSESDENVDPVPGMLAGGPNPGQEDARDCAGKYTTNLPAKSYIDVQCSYATNEVAINWNAPLAYLILSIEATKGKK